MGYQHCLKLSFLFLFITGHLLGQSLDHQIAVQEKIYNREKLRLEDLRFEKIKNQLLAVGLPTVIDDSLRKYNDTVFHKGFILSYNEKHEQANWVTHMILPQIFEFCTERTDDFRPDTTIKSRSATYELYSGLKSNKMDRGHLAPAADLRWSERAVSNSFYYSNITPQKSDLNQGRWADLEMLLRTYCRYYNTSLIVVSGPVLRDFRSKAITKLDNLADGVSVPDRFYKVALDLKRNRGIAFVMDQNTGKKIAFADLALSIDAVESITGLDFFPEIVDSVEHKIEFNPNLEFWDVFENLNDADPYPVEKLPEGALNTIELKKQATSLQNKVVTVYGKVISTSMDDEKGYVNLSMDKKTSPIYVRIEKENLWKFDQPHVEMRAQTISATGTFSKKQFGKSTYYYVTVSNSEEIIILR